MLTPQELANEAKGFTAIELAKRAGVSTKTVYRIRNGEMPSLPTYTALLDAIRQMNALGLKKKRSEVA